MAAPRIISRQSATLTAPRKGLHLRPQAQSLSTACLSSRSQASSPSRTALQNARTPTAAFGAENRVPQKTSKRTYYSYDHAQAAPFTAAEDAILSAALKHVPTHGFTNSALALGARDAGYLDASVNLFPRGAFDLINYHLVTERLKLKRRVDWEKLEKAAGKPLGVGRKVRELTWARLLANREIIGQWQGALAIMAQPTYIPPSITELARLADEIWFLAGDKSVDTSWYTKRASLSAVYSSTDVFMTQDKSTDYIRTQEFLDRRIADAQYLGSSLANLTQWGVFTGHSFVNVLRSKGVKI